MDFIRYAEASASLLNAELADRDDVVRHLVHREWLHDQCTDRDATVLRRFVRELRPVFEASEVDDTRAVIDGLNELMERHPITRGSPTTTVTACTCTSPTAARVSPTC